MVSKQRSPSFFYDQWHIQASHIISAVKSYYRQINNPSRSNSAANFVVQLVLAVGGLSFFSRMYKTFLARLFLASFRAPSNQGQILSVF